MRNRPDLNKIDPYVGALFTNNQGIPNSWTYGKLNKELSLRYSFNPKEIENFFNFAKKNPIHLFNDEQQALQKMVMKQWEKVANINFTETKASSILDTDLFIFSQDRDFFSTTASAAVQPLFLCHPQNDFSCYSQYTKAALVLNHQSLFASFSSTNIDQLETYSTLLHETGHVIGLNHPFENINIKNQIINKIFSVMNYDREERYIVFNNWGMSQSYYEDFLPITPSIYDIKTAQLLYGKSEWGKGNDTYDLVAKQKFAYKLSEPKYTFFSRANTLETIWDPNGQDILSANNTNEHVVINLNQGVNYRSNIGQHYFILSGNFEHVIAGNHTNDIILNSLNNIVDLRNSHLESIITTNIDASGQDIVMGFNPLQDKIILETSAKPSSWSVEAYTPQLVNFGNETFSFSYASIIKLNNTNNTITLINVTPFELTEANIFIKEVAPEEGLQRRQLVTHNQTIASEIVCQGGKAFVLGWGTSFATNCTQYLLKNKFHFSNKQAEMACAGIHCAAAWYYGGFSIGMLPGMISLTCNYFGVSPQKTNYVTTAATIAFNLPNLLSINGAVSLGCGLLGNAAANGLTFFARKSETIQPLIHSIIPQEKIAAKKM